MSSFRERLFYIRHTKQLTQRQMAQQLKLTPAHISNLENGRREPSDIIISVICTEFNVNETWLRTGEGEPFFNATHAMQREFASCFLQITRAFSPVFSAYGEMMPLFENKEIMRMYNYIALRVHDSGMTSRNLNAISSCFSVAFPGYEHVIMLKEQKSSLTLAGINSSKIARSLMPVQGVAAAGPPLYDDSTVDDNQEVPAKFGDGRFFIVRVKGDSMSPGIGDGDHVVVARNVAPENGELALVFIAGKAADEYVIKLFQQLNGSVRLSSYNPDYPSFSVPVSQIVSAEKIVHVIHELDADVKE